MLSLFHSFICSSPYTHTFTHAYTTHLLDLKSGPSRTEHIVKSSKSIPHMSNTSAYAVPQAGLSSTGLASEPLLSSGSLKGSFLLSTPTSTCTLLQSRYLFCISFTVQSPLDWRGWGLETTARQPVAGDGRSVQEETLPCALEGWQITRILALGARMERINKYRKKG